MPELHSFVRGPSTGRPAPRVRWPTGYSPAAFRAEVESRAPFLVLDAHPLRALQAGGVLAVLPRLYEGVNVSALTAAQCGTPARALRAMGIHVADHCPRWNQSALERWPTIGASITLAGYTASGVLATDSPIARSVFWNPMISTAGLLVMMKRAGLVRRVAPIVERIASGGISMDPRMIAFGRALAGE